MPLSEFVERYPALTSRLCQARANGRVAHAYLMTGDNSTLLAEFATAFLQGAVCESRMPNGDACGVCMHCNQLSSATYPNMREIKPQSKSRQIRVDDIYELEHFLHLTSSGAARIAVIHDADRMNVQTQNAFLKTLEEPSPNTVIMMLTCNPSQLLATIRSRCQLIALLDNKVVYDLLDPVRLFGALSKLKASAGAQVATAASAELIELLAQVRQTCEVESKSYIAELRSEGKEMEPAMRKQQLEEAEALLESQYRAQRELVLSAIHTWFGQEFIRSNGVAVDTLPNPECYDGMDAFLSQPAPTPRDARKGLKLAEKLLQTLNYNVDEKLAIDDFCHTLCAK